MGQRRSTVFQLLAPRLSLIFQNLSRRKVLQYLDLVRRYSTVVCQILVVRRPSTVFQVLVRSLIFQLLVRHRSTGFQLLMIHRP